MILKLQLLFVFILSKSSSFCKAPIEFWLPRITTGDVWCKTDSKSNCHGTCKFLVFGITCKFLICAIINLNKNIYESNV